MPTLSRRGLLKAGATGALALGFGRLRWIALPAAAEAASAPSYRDFRDVYREIWRWDACAHISQALRGDLLKQQLLPDPVHPADGLHQGGLPVDVVRIEQERSC